MNDSFKPQDAAELWKSQQTAGVTLSIDQIRQRIRQIEQKVKRQSRTGIWALGVWLAMAIVAALLPQDHAMRAWVLAVQMAAMVWWFIHHEPSRALHGNWLVTLDLNSRARGERSCLDFYRGELQFQRDRIRKNLTMLPVFALVLLALTLFQWRYRSAASAVPLGLPLLLLLASFIRQRLEAPGIQRHMEQLEAFRRHAEDQRG